MVIFLDIDGVLNRSAQWTRMYSLDTKCIQYFCDLVHAIRGKIILTSSWRTGFVATGSKDNLPQIKELEKTLAEYGVVISGKTPELNRRSRDKEIERYLYFNPTSDYLIIDDDRGEYKTITEHNYFTDCSAGFTERDFKILKKRYRC